MADDANPVSALSITDRRTWVDRDTNGAAVVCGPGADSTILDDRDRPTRDCAPHLHGLGLGPVDRCPDRPIDQGCKPLPAKSPMVGHFTDGGLDLALGRVNRGGRLQLRVVTISPSRTDRPVVLVARTFRVPKGPVAATEPTA